MSPAQILAKHLRQVGNDARRGLRVASVLWRRMPAARRSRIELGAVLSLLPLSAAIAALAAVPVAVDLDNIPQQTITETHELPPLEDQIARLAGRMDSFLREARIQRGDTLGSLFTRLEIDDADAARFIRSQPAAAPLQKFVPGRFVQAQVSQDGKLQLLKLFLGTDLEADHGKGRLLELERTPGSAAGFRLSERSFDYERRVEMRAGDIGSSLFGATDAAGVPDSIAQQMIGQKADSIFQVAGLSGAGAIEAACATDNVIGIGVDVDQSKSLSGDVSCVLTSAEKKLVDAVTAAIKKIGDKTDVGGTTVWDASTDPVGVGLSPYQGDFVDLVTPDIQAKIDAALAGMKDGSVDPCKPTACDDKS